MNIKINLSDLSLIQEDQFGDDFHLDNWRSEYENWKKHDFPKVHMMINYLKYYTFFQNKPSDLQKFNDVFSKDDFKEWVKSAFTESVDVSQIKGTILFGLRDAFKFSMSEDLLLGVKDYYLNNSRDGNAFIFMVCAISDINKKLDLDFFDDLITSSYIDNPDNLIRSFSLLKEKNELELFFKLLEKKSISINWNENYKNESVTRFNKLFSGLLKTNKSIEKLEFYIDSRPKLLGSLNNNQNVRDLKFFLKKVNVINEETIISALKKFPKTKISSEEFTESSEKDMSLMDRLLRKGSWRVLNKFCKSAKLSLSVPYLLSFGVKRDDFNSKTTLNAVLSLLNLAESNNDWFVFLNRVLKSDVEKEKINIPLYEKFNEVLKSFGEQKTKVMPVFEEKGFEFESDNFKLEIHKRVLNSLSKEDWLRETGENEVLLDKYLRASFISLSPVNVYSSYSNDIFAGTSANDLMNTNLSDVLLSLNHNESSILIERFVSFLDDNQAELASLFRKKIDASNKFDFRVSSLIEGLEIFIKIVNTLSLDDSNKDSVKKIDGSLQYYKKILEDKNNIYKDEDVKNKVRDMFILWESLVLDIGSPKNIPISKVKKF